ncbi:MAG: glycosyl hydrolase 53 family protein [Anaerolineales bacterium]|nr:glycosyl hydrolase 53 family protein [Anaerolineales bacterium]
MKARIAWITAVLLLSSCGPVEPPPSTPTAASTAAPPSPPPTAVSATPAPAAWLLGFDASYVTRVEDRGGVYRDAAGTAVDVFDLLQASGVDTVRLRVWHDPPEGYVGQADVLALARRAHAARMALLIDFHYSDVWADPAHQTRPAAWEMYAFARLETAVYDHTRATLAALLAQDTPPAIVQIGNEISFGLLWPDGQVAPTGAFAADRQWRQLTALLAAGIRGVRDAGSTAHILIHIAEGGQADNELGRWFFDRLTAAGLPFDLIGLSYYPAWHGNLDILAYNIQDLRARYGRPVVVVETAYPWTLGWHDWTHNTLGEAQQLLPGYPASPAGQRAFFQAVVDTARAADASGVFYWGGEWLATSPTDENGSMWENQALFDFEGRILPAMAVYGHS